MLYPRRVRQLGLPAVASLLIKPLSNTSRRHALKRFFPRRGTL